MINSMTHYVLKRTEFSKRQVSSSPRRWRGLVIFGAQPVDPDVDAAAEQQRQLTGVMLGVTKVVQQELADVQFVPPEPAALEGPFVSQPLEGFAALSQAVIGVVR